MHYIEFLKALHAACKPNTYLEIGIRNGRSLQLANCKAIGIDPNPKISYRLSSLTKVVQATSDEYFSSGKIENDLGESNIDLAFIDGFHNSEFALRDFINTEKYSSKTGVIVVDDILPRQAIEASRKPSGGPWTGDVWRVPQVLTEYRPDLSLAFVDVEPTSCLLVWDLDPMSNILANNYLHIEALLMQYPDGAMPDQEFKKRFLNPEVALKMLNKD